MLCGTCRRLHRSVVTLTIHRACVQLFYAMPDSRRVNDAQAPCLRTKSSFWELATFASFASFASFARGFQESSTAEQNPLPHAPGARMT